MHLHTLPRYGMPARAVLAFLLLIGFCSAAEPTKVFDVPPGEAAQTLKRYASQAGREIVFAESVGSVPTNAVKGELTPREALDVLLADTGLVGTIDAKTGAIAIRRETLEEAKNGESRPATSRTARSDGPLRLDEYEVIGLRDTGLVNEGVIPRRENEAIPYIVFDRLEIERSGATDLNEVLRSLPQVAAFQADTQSLTAQRGFATFGAGVTAATRVDLRGFGTQGTTILVNGRHMPLVRETQGGGPDISRIPLTAIDRIEVLPGSAGGIYGTNTMGGVINIVLKKNYAGRDLTLFYGMAAAGGANEVGLTYIEGRTLFGGRANLTWTFDARKREPLYYEDRPLYRRFLERNVSPMNGGSVPAWIAAGGMVNFVPRSGVIVGGTAAAFAPLNIPGATGTVNFASVPLNQNGSNLTPASFLGTANQMTVGEPYARFALYNPTESYSLNVTYNHELKKDRLFAYAELGLGYTFHEFQTPPQPQTVNLTATNPRNPFRTGVVPGYPGQAVRLFYLPADLPGTLQD
jgi:iron complex outermembrane recepter protein